MNKAYRLLWNRRLNAWAVASERARACGKRSSGSLRAGLAVVLLASAAGPAVAADLASAALPSGGNVVAGQAEITTHGTRMDITQDSQRAIINWQGFDIGSDAQVNFSQPGASAVTLNRVSGTTASRIEGQLTANGQVFLVNPNGVLFGGGARVNASALVASTLNIGDDDFLAGRYAFSGNGGVIDNLGTITATPGGYLAFIAPQISNRGTLNAPQGTVALGGGERVTLNFAGNRLVGLSVSAATLDALIDNRQAILAAGGTILLSAAGAETVARGVINQNGVLEASSLTENGGRIVLSAGDDINLGAGSTMAVDGRQGGEISVRAQSGTLLADGLLSARGASANGGTVELLGTQVGLVNAARVDVSGETAGGTVLVGGDYQGNNPAVQNADRSYVGADATIVADARADGNGGKVVVWANDATQMYGAISARGGANSGDGGLVETSGRQWLDFQGRVDLRAANGRAGNLLLDPTDITISGAANTPTTAFGGGIFSNPTTTPSNLNVVTLTDQLALGNVTVSTASGLGGNGDITVNNAINYASANSLTLDANRSISIVAGSGGISNTGTGAVTLTGAGAGSIAVNESITTGGGAIALTSGSSGITLAASKAIDAGSGTIALNAGGGAVNLSTGSLRTSNATAAAASVANATTLALGNVALNGGGTLSVSHSSAGSQAAGASISGTGGLVKSGSGTLTLSQINTYLGFTTVNAGTLAVSGGNAIADSGAVILANAVGVALNLTASETIGSLAGGGVAGGNLTKGTAGAATLTTGGNGSSTSFGGVIQNGSGTVSLVKEGAGTFTMTNTNTYTGTTTASGGTLALAGTAGSATGSNLTVNAGAQLLLDNSAANNDNRVAGTLTLNGGEFAVLGNATANTTETLGALNIVGGYSTVTVTPDAARNAQLTFASLARTAGAAALFRGTHLGANTVVSQTAGSSNIVFTTAPTLTGGGGNSGTTTVSILAGAIGAGGASGSSSAGTDFVTYNPPTGAANGLRPLLASEYAAAPAANVNLRLTANRTADDTFSINSLLLSGGVTYDHDATGAANTLTIASGNVLSVGGSNTIQPTQATGTVAFGATDVKLFTVSDLILGSNAQLTGTGVLGKAGLGMLQENRSVTRTGGIIVNAGLLRSGVNNAFASQAMTVRSVGTLDLNGFNNAVSSLTLESGATSGATVNTGTGTLTLAGNVALNVNGAGATGAVVGGNIAATATRTFTINNGIAANDLTVTAVLSGAGGVTKSGTGTLALYGANTYTGVTRVNNNGGILSVNTLADGGVASSIGASGSAASNLVLDGNTTLQYVGDTASTNRNVTLTAGRTSTIDVVGPATNLTLGGATTATTGALIKRGAGLLTLSGVNRHTGLTTVAGGTLAEGASNALASGGVTVTGGATFDIGGYSDTVGVVTLTDGTITGTSGVLTGTGATAYAVSNGTVNAILGGSGGLTKATSGTVTLTRDNTYTGATTINGGILSVASLADGGVASNIGASANGAGNLVLGGGILRYTGASAATDRNYTLTAGTTSSIDVTNAAASLTIGGASAATTGALTKLGDGTLTLTGANANTGTTTIRVGTLQVGNGGATGNLGTGAVVNLGKLVFNRNNALLAVNAVSSFGELVQLGAGTTTLAGANTYTGATTISAGTLQLGAANRIADASAVTVAAGATFNLAGFAETVGSIAGAGNIALGSGTLTTGGNNATTTFAGLVSGTGGITKSGTGTLTLSGANTYSGTTSVNAGTLVAANGSALGAATSGTTVAAGATLNLDNIAIAGESITINGAGVAGAGALTGNGNASVAGGITLAGASSMGTTAAASSLNLDGVVSAPSALTIVGAGDVTATNAANDFSSVAVSNAGNVSLRDTNAVTINASTLSGTLSVQAAGALTVAGGITAAGAGDAIVLSGGRFINSVGASALTTTNGRWLVWSGNPDPFGGATPDVRNGLAYDFKQYDATFGVTPVAQATGHGFLFALAPTLTPGLTGTTDKVYDGTTAATLLEGNVTVTGAVDGDDVSVAWTGSAFDDRNAGVGKAVTASGITVSPSNAGTPVYGYTLASATATANIGTITPASLTVTAQADTRVYDGTTSSSAAPILSGTTYDAVGSAAIQSFDDRNAGTGKTLTASGLVMNDGNGGANYNVSYADNTAGVITPASLTVTAQADSRVYDGTINSGAAPILSGTTYDAVGSAAIQSFDNRNAGSGKTLTASGLVMNDGNGGANYTVNYVDSSAGTIAAAALTVTAQADSRVYNGTTSSSAAPVLSGTTYDSVGSAAIQSCDDRNAGTGKTLTASGLVMNDGNGGANYTINYVDSNAGVITPASLTVTAQADSRVYDGTINSGAAPILSGTIYDAVGSAATQSFDDRNAGTGKTLTASGLVMNDGNGGANYTVNYVDSNAGVISPAPLSIVADDAERLVNTPNPPFTASYVGLVGGDTPASLTGILEFQSTASIESPEGSYLITPFGQSSTNYDIVYVDGVLEVKTRVDVPDLSGEVRFDPQAFAASYSGQTSPVLHVPQVQYVTDEDTAGSGEPASTIRIKAGGLNVSR